MLHNAAAVVHLREERLKRPTLKVYIPVQFVLCELSTVLDVLSDRYGCHMPKIDSSPRIVALHVHLSHEPSIIEA